MAYRLCSLVLETTVKIGSVPYELKEIRRTNLSALVSIARSDKLEVYETTADYADEVVSYKSPHIFRKRTRTLLTDHIRDHYTHDFFRVPRGNFREMVADFERLLFADVLALYPKKEASAHALLMPRMTLNYRLQKLGKLEVNPGQDNLEVRFPLTNYEDIILACEHAIFSDALSKNDNHARRTAASLKLPLSTFKNHLARVGIVIERPAFARSTKSLEDEIIRDFKREHPEIYRVLEHEFRQKVINASRSEDKRRDLDDFVDGQTFFDPDEGVRMRYDKETGSVPIDID